MFIRRPFRGSSFQSSSWCKPRSICRLSPHVPSFRMYGLPYCFEICGPRTLLSVNSKYWGSKRGERRGILCRVAGTCPRRPLMSRVPNEEKQQMSTLYAAETATTFHLSRLSDQMGRKFVFLACTLGLSVFISGFGLSTTFWALIFWFVPCLN